MVKLFDDEKIVTSPGNDPSATATATLITKISSAIPTPPRKSESQIKFMIPHILQFSKYEGLKSTGKRVKRDADESKTPSMVGSKSRNLNTNPHTSHKNGSDRGQNLNRRGSYRSPSLDLADPRRSRHTRSDSLRDIDFLEPNRQYISHPYTSSRANPSSYNSRYEDDSWVSDRHRIDFRDRPLINSYRPPSRGTSQSLSTHTHRPSYDVVNTGSYTTDEERVFRRQCWDENEDDDRLKKHRKVDNEEDEVVLKKSRCG